MGFAEPMTVVDDFAARVGSTPDGLLWGKDGAQASHGVASVGEVTK